MLVAVRDLLAANCRPPHLAPPTARSGVLPQVADADDIRAGEPVSLTVALEREAEGELRPVDAPR